MPIRIVGNRLLRSDFVMDLADMEFSQEDFDVMFGAGRELAHNLRSEGINPKDDFGEDLLLLAMGQFCIETFGQMNFQLCHVAYRFVDNEVENGEFRSIEFQY